MKLNYIYFNKYRLASYIASVFLILLSIVFVLTRGFNLSIDFTGGMIVEFTSPNIIGEDKTRELLTNIKIKDYTVQKSNQITIIKIGAREAEGDYTFLINRLKNAIVENFGEGVDFVKIDFVSSQIGKELAYKAFLAILLSLAVILIYIGVRFELRYSFGAIVGLFHDVIITIGFISVFHLPVDVSTIAAILTVVGYSINDSVVVFDRIRQNFKTIKKEETNDAIIEGSINQMLTRTIITSLTTLISILAIILIGGSVLKSFALIIFFGILIGTLSSIFISPIFLYKKNITTE